MEKLTKQQQRVYDYVVEYIAEHGYPPAVREIGKGLGLTSPSTVHFHLKHLVELGYINKGNNLGRAIAPVDRSAVAPKSAPPAEEKLREIPGIPILGNVAAGAPILAEECIEDYLPYDNGGRPGEFFALRVRGFSMKNIGILPDDLVVVKKQPEVHNGEIVVALLGDEATVKRFKREGKRIWLLPENEEFSPIDGTEAQIMGRVTAVVREY